MRRKIMNMSVADEENMYPFPDDIPINIANPADIKKLKDIFAAGTCTSPSHRTSSKMRRVCPAWMFHSSKP